MRAWRWSRRPRRGSALVRGVAQNSWMNSLPPRPPTSYDLVPYDSLPFSQSHPDRLATVARLMGLQPAAVEGSRVLELGCAGGGNLVPMAAALPQARFVGVDLSPVQVAQGQRVIDALGLTNIELHAASITEVDAAFGEFDYIVSHGVYSWVPDAVQQALLRVCAERLAPAGVAYVSYNTLPGWRMRGMVRDLMRYHAAAVEEPAERVAQARAILDFLARSVPADNDAYGLLLRSELKSLQGAADSYIQHEHLESVNEPVYFHEFAARASAHGLLYLGEADFSAMLSTNFAPEVHATLRRIAPDLIRQEQYMDFLRNRSFRQTLLVHEGAAVQRHVVPARVRSMWIASPLKPAQQPQVLDDGVAQAYHAPGGGALTTPNAVTKAAMGVLAERWPAATAFDELLQGALARLHAAGVHAADDVEAPGLPAGDTLASDLLQCQAAGLLELRTRPSDFCVAPGERPVASALARWQAQQGHAHVTSLSHDTVNIDPAVARLLPLLDGRHDRAAIARTVAAWGTGGPGIARRPDPALVRRIDEQLSRTLDGLGRAALLVA